MEEKKPIKRHKSLQPLSREHHHGLLLCWKIRTGITKGIEAERIKKYAEWFYENSLLPHFTLEEKYFFPLLGNDNELVKQALAEHEELNNLFKNIEANENMLSKISDVLEKHIRFEERVLFNEIQKYATADQMEKVDELHTESTFCENENDMFWIS